MLCNKQFSQKTTKWFTQEAIEEAKIHIYDQATNTIEVDETKLNQKRNYLHNSETTQ